MKITTRNIETSATNGESRASMFVRHWERCEAEGCIALEPRPLETLFIANPGLMLLVQSTWHEHGESALAQWARHKRDVEAQVEGIKR